MNGGGAALQAQSLVHTSVFSPPPALHPYQDLALGWQQSSKLLDHCQGVSTELVQAWDQQSVASFITSVTGSQRCGAVFQERVRNAALMPFIGARASPRAPSIQAHSTLLKLS